MTSFKQFLMEQPSSTFPPAAIAALRHSSEITERWLVRGVSGSALSNVIAMVPTKDPKYSTQVMKGLVRKDRKPLDTGETVTDVIDDWFLEKFGYRARTQGLFAIVSSGNQRYATAHYGFPSLIGVPGKFKIIYSPKVEDLTVEFTDNQIHAQTPKDKIIEYMESREYVIIDGKIPNDVGQCELMIVGADEYYAFSPFNVEKRELVKHAPTAMWRAMEESLNEVL